MDDDATLRANREGFKHVQLRPRRLRDATKVDMRTDLFGTMYDSPIFTCPTGGEKCLHPDGELAVARATKARGTMQMLSTSTSTGSGGSELRARQAGVVPALRSFRVAGMREDCAAGRSGRVSGDRANRR